MILCCGEALIDMLPRTLPDGALVFLPTPGGAIFNTAIALGRLGQDAGLFTGLSTDLFGSQLADTLKASNVDYSLAIRSNLPTTLAFVRLSGGTAEYAFYDENTAGRMVTEADLPGIQDSVDAMHFGAISLVSEPAGSAYETLALREAKNCVISLDPNIRPDFIDDAEGHRDRINRLINVSDIVKVSDEDLNWLIEGATFEDAAHHWLANGVSLVLMTMGANGARAFTREHDLTVPSPQVDIVDTVGAGDTFNAGLLASIRRSGALSNEGLKALDEETLVRAIETGCKVASITVSRSGANPPFINEVFGV